MYVVPQLRAESQLLWAAEAAAQRSVEAALQSAVEAVAAVFLALDPEALEALPK